MDGFISAMNTLLFIAAAAIMPAAPAAKPVSAAQVLGQVRKTYHGKSVQADFTQTYIDSVVGPRPSEAGELKASGDGRVRFEYLAPEHKHFVFDGKDAFFYEPEAAQVTILEQFAAGPAAQTMAFLWGEGALADTFAAQLCAMHCPAHQPYEVALTLTPQRPMAGVQRIDLVIDGRSFEVHETVLTDPLNNRTRYVLDHRTLGAKIDAKTFTFVVPQGVSVLRTQLGESQSNAAP